MNRMKRKLSICLALIMALTVFGGLSITVMAEDYTYNATVPNDASPYEVRVAPNTYVNINFRVTNGYSAVVKIGIDNGTKSERVHLGIYTGTMAFPYESAVSSKTKNIVVTDLSDTVLMQIPITVSWTTDPTPTPNPPSGGSDSSSTSSKSHTHSYSWEDVRPATEDDNGEIAYKCSCGEVLYRVPTSAYYVFNKNTQDKIKNAKQGATVKI